MTIKRGIEEAGQFMPNANQSLLDPDASLTRVVITSVNMFANTATTNVELFIVPPSGSPAASNQILKRDFSLKESYSAPELIGKVILLGGSLTGNDGGNGGAKVNITITTTTFSGDS